MNKQTIKLLTFFVAGLFSFYGCNFSDQESSINEGKIIYTIDYLASEESNPLISLLPENLEMAFKKDNIIMSVEGWMGIFKSGFLRDSDSGKKLTLLKVMNKKYYYENVSDENFMGVTSYVDLDIAFDTIQKTIIGFDCDHAVVNIPHRNVSFDVYYTSEIDILNPNDGTPFSEVPGVLLEFQLEMNGIPMHILADRLQQVSVAEKTFNIPDGYEEVDKQVVDELIASLLE